METWKGYSLNTLHRRSYPKIQWHVKYCNMFYVVPSIYKWCSLLASLLTWAGTPISPCPRAPAGSQPEPPCSASAPPLWTRKARSSWDGGERPKIWNRVGNPEMGKSANCTLFCGKEQWQLYSIRLNKENSRRAKYFRKGLQTYSYLISSSHPFAFSWTKLSKYLLLKTFSLIRAVWDLCLHGSYVHTLLFYEVLSEKLLTYERSLSVVRYEISILLVVL